MSAATAVVTLAACSGGSARHTGWPAGATSAAISAAPSTTPLAAPASAVPTTVPTSAPTTLASTTTTTTTLPRDQRLAAAIARRAGYALTADEATCTAAALTPASIDAIAADAPAPGTPNAPSTTNSSTTIGPPTTRRTPSTTDTSGADDPGTDVTAALGAALARCEPAAFVASTAALVAEQWGVTADQATCVTHAVDGVAATSPAVAAVVLSNWGDLAAGDERDALIGAVATCVDPDLAVTIVGG